MTQTLGANQIAWLKENVPAFTEPDGKTRLERFVEQQQAMRERRSELNEGKSNGCH